MPNAKFAPIDSNLMQMIDNLKYACPLHLEGCKKILDGSQNDIAIHQTTDCEYADLESINWNSTDKILCCGKYTIANFRYGHLCNPKQEDRFCSKHKDESCYLITFDKIVD